MVYIIIHNSYRLQIYDYRINLIHNGLGPSFGELVCLCKARIGTNFNITMAVFLLGVSREMLQALFAIVAPNTFLDQIHAV
jgi:hypothetical protein